MLITLLLGVVAFFGLMLGYPLRYMSLENFWDTRYIWLTAGASIGTLVTPFWLLASNYANELKAGMLTMGGFTIGIPLIFTAGWLEWQFIHLLF